MTLNRQWRLAGAGLTLALVLAACGGGEEESGDGGGLSGTLNGAGASSQEAAMNAWRAGFEEANPDVTVNYDPAGSGAGREQFTSGAVDFAGSDRALNEEELAAAKEQCGSDAIDLPMYVSPIAVIYNLEGVTDLQLKPATIAGIFKGEITTWNDPKIVADNPGKTLPATRITPVHRSDDSGTTTNFTEYLAGAAPSVWTLEPDGEWPAEIKGGEAAQGTSGVVAAVKGGQGTIGYADESQAGDLGIAKVGVGSEYVTPSAEAAAAVLDNSEKAAGRTQYDLAYELARDTTESGVYPIVLVSYHVACLSYADAAKADLVKAFLTYVASEEGQQKAAETAGSAPLSSELRTQVKASIDQIKAAG